MKEKENVNYVDIKERLNDYLLKLKSEKIIKNNQDIVDSGLAAKATISRAINGKEKSLTKSLVKKIIDQYGEYGFTLEYIWYGNEILENEDSGSFESLNVNQKLDLIYKLNLGKLSTQENDIKFLNKKVDGMRSTINELNEKIDQLQVDFKKYASKDKEKAAK